MSPFSFCFCYNEEGNDKCCHRLLLWFSYNKEGDNNKLSLPFSFWFCCSEEGDNSKLPSPSFFGSIIAKKVTATC
jgi:hypothetical protein